MVDKSAEVRRNFLVFHPDEAEDIFDDHIELATSDLIDVVYSLKESVYSIISATSFPYVTANRTSNDRIFQAIHTAEKIRHLRTELSPGEYPKEESDAAYNSTVEKFRERIYSPENQVEMQNRVIDILLIYIMDKPTLTASKELLKQATVSLWGAFEVFINDITKMHINANPNLARPILNSDATKRHFSANPFSIDSLHERGFDIKNSVGDIIFAGKRMGNIKIMTEIYSVITGKPDLARSMFGSRFLHELNQRRHLLVHQRGVIDKDYIDNTNSKATIGSQLIVTGTDVENYIDTILATSKSVLKALTDNKTQNEK